ncbi:MAG TPA: PAS domain S-box protein, partial [Enterovirga sp.]
MTAALPSAASASADNREKDAILNAIQIGVYGVDDKGRCTFINQAGLDLIGYARDEVIGRNMHDLIHHTYPDGSPYPQAACPLLSTLASGHTVRLDNETLWRKDGTFFTAEYSSFPVLDQGVVTGSVITFQDTTQRGQAQRRLALQITVSRILAGSADMDTTMSRVLEAICSGLGWQVGVFWTVDHREIALRASTIWASPSLQADAFLAQTAERSLQPGLGLSGRAWEADAPEHIDDLAADPNFQRREAALAAGLRFAFAFPVKAGTQTLGVAEFFGREGRHVGDGFLDSIATLGQQIGQYQRRKWAEEALRDSEARFRTLANAIPQLAWTADPDGGINWYNERWYEFTGTTFESVQGWAWRSLQHPDHAERVVAHFTQAIGAGEPWQDTFPLRGKDGRYRWFLSRAVPLRDDGGRIWGWFGTNTDVTEEREAEDRALAAERRLTLALESARIGAWSWDSTTDLVEADSRVRDIFGLAQEGAIPITEFFSRIHPEDVPRVTARLETARQSSDAYDMDFRIVLPSAEVRWVVSRGLVGARPRGEPGLTMTGITWEVTDQKIAEAGLRHSEERFRSLIEATAAIVWTTKASGEFGGDQPDWSTFTGQSPQEMQGWGWLDAIHPDDRDATAEAWREAIEARAIYKIEHRLRRQDGEYRHMLVRAVPIVGESGAIREWVGV